MRYSFSTFVFDAASGGLTRQGRRVALEPQPARALALLLARAGEVVTREEMRLAIWGAETHVDYDRGLAYCIGQVRSALGDAAEQPRFVQTLPKRGFRFVAPVGVDAASAPASAAPASAAPAPAAPAPAAPTVPPLVAAATDTPPVDASAGVATGDAAATTPLRWRLAALAGVLLVVAVVGWRTLAVERRPVVAVSIFDNETGDPTFDGFVAGLSDVVVAELTNLAPDRVGVVGNAAALRQLRNIRNLQALATAVDADYVVLGQLQRQDDQLRFIVHFIRLDDEVHLSAQRFVRPVVDASGFEQDVVTEAVRAVRAVVLAAKGP